MFKKILASENISVGELSSSKRTIFPFLFYVFSPIVMRLLDRMLLFLLYGVDTHAQKKAVSDIAKARGALQTHDTLH